MLRLKGRRECFVLLQGFGTGIYLRTHLQLRFPVQGCRIAFKILETGFNILDLLFFGRQYGL